MILENLTDTQQDYLEAVYFLSEKKTGDVQLVDIAKELKVKPPSAIEVIGRLKDMELLEQPRRDKIILTEPGLELAKQLAIKHNTILDFFVNILRVPRVLAEEDACKVEHALGPLTFSRLCDFLEHLDSDSIEKDNTVPLTMMNRGEKGQLKRIIGGENKKNRLAAMGIHVGEFVEVLQNKRGTPIMIKSDESRIAIGRALATQIHVLITGSSGAR